GWACQPNASGISEIGFDRFNEARNRNRFGNIGLASALPYPLLIPLHGEGRHRDYGNRPQLLILLQAPRDLETGNLRELDVHQNEIRIMFARKRKRLETATRTHG